MNKCKRCGYEWTSRKANPRSCPYCKSYKWNETKHESVELSSEEWQKILASPKAETSPNKPNQKHCIDCGDLVASINSFGRCEGCQAEFEYQQAMKEKE